MNRCIAGAAKPVERTKNAAVLDHHIIRHIESIESMNTIE